MPIETNKIEMRMSAIANVPDANGGISRDFTRVM
jgi:hypothetical protein